MSQIKTSELPYKGTLVNTDSFVFVDPLDHTQAATGTTKQASVSSVANFNWSLSANYNVDKIQPLNTTVQSNSAGWQGKANSFEVIKFNSAIEDVTGLATIPTTNLPVSSTIIAYDALTTNAYTKNMRIYKLVANSSNTAGEYIVRPNDFSGGNIKVWAWANPVYRYDNQYTVYLAEWGTGNGVIGDPSRPFNDLTAFPYGFANYIKLSKIEILDGRTYNFDVIQQPAGSQTYLDFYVTGHPNAALNVSSLGGSLTRITSDKSVVIYWNANNVVGAMSPVELRGCKVGSVTQYGGTTTLVDCLVEGSPMLAQSYNAGGSGSGSGSGTPTPPGQMMFLSCQFTKGASQIISMDGSAHLYMGQCFAPPSGNIMGGTQSILNTTHSDSFGF